MIERAPAQQSRRALRRYPALAWLVAAGLLALLLPSGLTLPQSGPSTLAEYAPVPGAGEGSADLGELAATQSGGVGSGGRGDRAAASGGGDDEPPPARTGKFVRKAGTKRCVGEPPRQTEDPLSPPCIAFFDGDNGGATAKGVTGDTIAVAVDMADVDVGDPRERQVIDCADEPDAENDTIMDLACKAYMRFFNDRYQTYDRAVRLLSAHSVNVPELDEKYGLFAHLNTRQPSSSANRQVIGFGFRGTRRSTYARNAPYAVSFSADEEDQAALAATYVCNKLVGGTARYAGDPLFRDDQRVFGFWYQEQGYRRQRDLLHAAIKDSCGVDVRFEATQPDNPTAAAALRSNNVTTVIAFGNRNHLPLMTKMATDHGYFPEWFIPSASDATGFDANATARLAVPAQWQNAFGITLDYRRDAITDQPWFRAYREGCPSCPEPRVGMTGVNDLAAAYDTIAMLFYAIQAAGPRLTAENVDRGLHSIPSDRSVSPYKPAAYFSPGNWSFVKDATAIWWDPAGRAPSASGAGCYRLVDGGTRFRAGEWPRGDGDVKGAGPCQADKFAGT